MHHIGILQYSLEGAILCYREAAFEAMRRLGEHRHPLITMAGLSMADTIADWDGKNYAALRAGTAQVVDRLARAGADFFVMPDNTAHIALERVAHTLPIPGLHIADVVCTEIKAMGCSNAGLLGTRWMMTGPVYAAALQRHGIGRLVPNEKRREQLNRAIFDELCQAKFLPRTTDMFVDAINELKADGADCVILGCTEIPLIITDANSPLPTLDSTRLLARAALQRAVAAGGKAAPGRREASR